MPMGLLDSQFSPRATMVPRLGATWSVSTRATPQRPPPKPLSHHERLQARVGILLVLALWSIASQVDSSPWTVQKAPATPPELSSLELLQQSLHWNTSIVPESNVSHEVSSLPPADYVYVNCAATTVTRHTVTSLIAPRSLQQCHELMRERGALSSYMDHDIVTILPRDDLFPSLATSRRSHRSTRTPPRHVTNPAFYVSTLEPLGSLYFHVSSSVHNKNRTNDVAWFTNTILEHSQFPYYTLLGETLARAYGCTQPNGTLFDCPSRPQGVKGHDGASSHTWKVPSSALTHVLATMYLPPPDSRVDSTRDPTTPSIGLFRYAFCDMKTGRIVLHIPQPRLINSTDEPVTHFRQVQVQPNSCHALDQLNAPDKNKLDFPLKLTATTPVADSGACQVYDRAIVITSAWSAEFYHSLVETLPRLLLLKDWIERLDDPTIPIIVLQSYRKTTHLKFLADVWGLGHRLTYVHYGCTVYADRMYIPEPTVCMGLPPKMAQAHRHAIRTVVQPQDAAVTNHTHAVVDAASSGLTTSYDKPTTIVVIRRRQKRYLRNHDELMDALTTALPHATWRVFDEGESLPLGVAQWSLFAPADLVLAPHGAGLSNLLAVASGTHVVEFLGVGKVELCYLHLSLALNLHYHHVRMEDPYEGDKSYTVNVPHVVDVVTGIVESMKPRKKVS